MLCPKLTLPLNIRGFPKTSTEDMATEKQIAANRANAAKSTGPRSVAGKKRVSRNAFAHGLTLKYSSSELTRQLEERARQIASDTKDEYDLEAARTVAEAELEIARVRRIKVGLIERVAVMGGFEPPKHFTSKKQQRAWFNATLKWIEKGQPKPLDPVWINPADTMPSTEPERRAEAVRRALSELARLWRYESRAVARMNRGIKAMIAGRSDAQ
jgi:hypothetical protein